MNTSELMTMFVNHECCIAVDGYEEEVAFLELCEMNGIRWSTGRKATSYNPLKRVAKSRIWHFFHSTDEGMCWGVWAGSGYKCVVFSDFVNQPDPDIEVDATFLESILTT